MRLVTADEMQALDRRTIEGGFVPSLALMENAGQAAAREALELLAGSPRARVEVLCGKGNNGGDGLVVARELANRGARVRIRLTHPPEAMSPDARANYARTAEAGIETHILPAEIPDSGRLDDPRGRPRYAPGVRNAIEENPDDIAASIAGADVVVDGLLGTGVTSDLRGRLAALVDLINKHSRRTLAIDIPSGVDGNTGEVRGTAVWADVTVTFGLPKLGLVLYPGRERAGRIVVADIGIPGGIVEALAPQRYWVTAALARALVPRLEPTAHKYQRGVVLVIAGSRAYTGAAALAAEGALRAGAGMVHLLVPESVQKLLQAKRTELIVHGAPETAAGTSAAGAEAIVESLLPRLEALALGPGLGSDPETRAWVARLLARLELPAVVDADAIPSLPGPTAGSETPPVHRGPRVATPHAGELARWLGRPAAEVAADRLRVASESAPRLGVVLVAKGAPTFVASPAGELYVNGSGNPGLATAGSGDVLTGMIAGLLAQRLPARDAAVLGVYLHGLAADIAIRSNSPRSLLAGDLLAHLGLAYRELEA